MPLLRKENLSLINFLDSHNFENMITNPWILAFRPKTLTAAIVPVFVGSALSYKNNQVILWEVIIFTILASLFIQIGTNLFNDVMDFKKGADNEKRIGPTRATQTGLISAKWVQRGAHISFLLAILCGIPLVQIGGLWIVSIGALSVLMGYAYTGGPYPLAYKGLGDLFVILFFGLIAVGGIYFLHTSHWSFDCIIAGLQIGFLATVLIAINNLRDAKEDALVEKRTLAVRWGVKFAKWEILFLLHTPFILSFYWILDNPKNLGIVTLLLWPLAFKLSFDIWKMNPDQKLNKKLSQAGALHFIFGSLLSMGLLFS